MSEVEVELCEHDQPLNVATNAEPERPALVVGDVVRLKSGGTWMTVETVFGERAHCVWQPIGTGSGLVLNTSRDQFPMAALEKRTENRP